MKHWFLIDTGFKDPIFNMDFDEKMMEYIKDKDIVILRFFNFSPPSITLGKNQDVPEWVIWLNERGYPYVKRPTGGRAVIHSNDFTYSICFKRDNELIGGSILDSYKKISEGFKRAFEILGINVQTSERKGKITSELCFDDLSIYELSFNGKKLIGSAQARRRDVCLQQGTCMLDQPEKIFPKSEGMITIKEATGRRVELREFKEIVMMGFEEVFGVRFLVMDNEKIEEISGLRNQLEEYD